MTFPFYQRSKGRLWEGNNLGKDNLACLTSSSLQPSAQDRKGWGWGWRGWRGWLCFISTGVPCKWQGSESGVSLQKPCSQQPSLGSHRLDPGKSLPNLRKTFNGLAKGEVAIQDWEEGIGKWWADIRPLTKGEPQGSKGVSAGWAFIVAIRENPRWRVGT